MLSIRLGYLWLPHALTGDSTMASAIETRFDNAPLNGLLVRINIFRWRVTSRTDDKTAIGCNW